MRRHARKERQIAKVTTDCQKWRWSRRGRRRMRKNKSKMMTKMKRSLTIVKMNKTRIRC